MINPSAAGWIDKFFTRLNNRMPLGFTPQEYYLSVRESGFIYGHVVSFIDLDISETKGWTTEEVTKAALLDTLYDLYRLETRTEVKDEFINKAIAYYKQMTPEGFSLFKKVLPASSPSHMLEDILDERVQTNDNVISRSFSHIITNALLFIDVLGFRQYLIHGTIPDKYLKKLESTVMGVVSMALKTKKLKTTYDDLLMKLFESSVRYTKVTNEGSEVTKTELEYFRSELERNYLLDMAGMAIWTDGMADQSEIEFLYRLANSLGIEDNHATESIASFDVFIKLHKKDISYFKYSNPVKHFYDHTSQSVALLINRNKNRLIKELSNNGELVRLLTHSTHRNLNEKEKKKVKKQLLEVCKTVPSLTIFLLPGGSLLLPLLIKFIPQMLPSVFNENLDNE
jgi:hypothetical protein